MAADRTGTIIPQFGPLMTDRGDAPPPPPPPLAPLPPRPSLPLRSPFFDGPLPNLPSPSPSPSPSAVHRGQTPHHDGNHDKKKKKKMMMNHDDDHDHDDDDDDEDYIERDSHRYPAKRMISKSSTFPQPLSMLSSRASRSSRPTVPSPLSTPNNVALPALLPKSSLPDLGIVSGPRKESLFDSPSRGDSTPTSTGGITFYSDSSNPSSPTEASPRKKHFIAPNDIRSVLHPVIASPAKGSILAATSIMAGPVATALQESPSREPLVRKSSVDSVISTATSTMQGQGSNNHEQRSQDIARLIKTAGSAEAAIQHLLKEKQSQSQQNGQLWRLVDKQRAMILGLNKDLETALRDKEKYRRKFKELMTNPTLVKVTHGQGPDGKHADARCDVVPGPTHVGSPEQSLATLPDSPTLDSASQRTSPAPMASSKYPITPPADRTHTPPAVVAGLPRRSTEERHPGARDEAAADKGSIKVPSDKTDERSNPNPTSATSFSASFSSSDPSRSLKTKKLPPKLPNLSNPPVVNVVEPTPQPNEGRAKFPSPPRKGPPAPLQLNQNFRNQLPSLAVIEDSDSDVDDVVLDAEDFAVERRGRRKTREEDDRQREALIVREAEARSTSTRDQHDTPKTSSVEPPATAIPIPMATPNPATPANANAPHEAGLSALFHAVLGRSNSNELVPPSISPGLPASPRPLGSASLTPASTSAVSQGLPLSPFPPRPHPSPLPPHTPVVLPFASGSQADGGISPNRTENVLRRMAEASYKSGHTKTQSGPVGRMKIYRGLVTEEYPDLLLPPNALPSIDVKVVSSRMKLPRASLIALTQLDEDPVFTLAVYSRASNGELWRMEKDSASLLKLDQRLKQCSAFTAKTPDRSLFHGHSPAKLDCRREALDQYLDELLNTPLDASTAEELCRYLSTNTLPPYADEVGFTYRPTGDAVHTIPENRCALTGYLTKKGKNFGGWKARFFVLDGLLLKYYESPGGTYLGAIRLQNAQIGKQSQGSDGQSTEKAANDGDFDDQYRHAFLILEQKKKDSNHFIKHVLCAESDVERDMWVDGLKGIDQQEANDEAQGSKPSSLDRPSQGQTPISGSSTGGSKSKKGASARTHSAGLDTLIGVRYDSLHPGEVPSGAPSTRPRTAGAPEITPAGGDAPQSFQQKVISGPRDPQLISDSTAWGNKAAPTPINSAHDEKKQRKRSFFGFGARSRNSSDGHDGAFGGGESGVSPTPAQSAYLQSMRPVFGSPLAEAVRFNAPHDVRVPVPAVVYRCIEYLESRNAILEEGIFRLSGSNIVIKQLRERFDTEGDVNLVTDEQFYDIHAVASLLKLYLRELPTSILTRDLHFEFLSITEMTDRERKLAALRIAVLKLPQANLTLLKYLIAFLIRIINKAEINKMTIRNVGIVFSPTLHVPAPVFAIFLSAYEAIFGVDPEEYELPILAPEEDGSSGRAASTPRLETPDRPSTSSGNGSPHVHPWTEGSRSTPTPPLLMSLNTARGSPTMHGPTRQSSEPSHPMRSCGAGMSIPPQIPEAHSDSEAAHRTGSPPGRWASHAPEAPAHPWSNNERKFSGSPASDRSGSRDISSPRQQQQQQQQKREEGVLV